MRIPVVLLVLALPHLAHAQLFKSLEIGTYVLSATPKVSQQGGLYLRNGEQLQIRDLTGKNTTYSPQQVSSFRIYKRQFVSTGGFELRGGFGNTYVAQAFAEQLDSGQVVLLRYQRPDNTAPTRGNLGYDNGAGRSVYLLRPATSFAVTPIQAGWTKNSRPFQEALRPFLNARPDLTQLLEAKQLAPDQLPLIIHALNNNLPYPEPAGRTTRK
jgi:hypothetical protein